MNVNNILIILMKSVLIYEPTVYVSDTSDTNSSTNPWKKSAFTAIITVTGPLTVTLCFNCPVFVVTCPAYCIFPQLPHSERFLIAELKL